MFGDFSSFKIIKQIHKFNKIYQNSQNKKNIIFCIPNTLIYEFKKKIKSNSILIGAQNCHHEEGYGPFTGSVSAKMIKKTGAQYIILGHSENRADGESNKIIKKKIITALNQNLKVIFCIGESLKQKNEGRTFSIIKKQINNSIVKNKNLDKLIIAYEPVWSIGTGKTLNTAELRKIFIYIKKYFIKNYKFKKDPPILYGGSVNEKNISKFSKISEIDGFLIGGASQSSKKFIDIIKNYYK